MVRIIRGEDSSRWRVVWDREVGDIIVFRNRGV